MSRLPRPPLTPLLAAVVVLVVGYFVTTTVRNVYHNYELHQQESQIRRDIAQLDRDHQQLVAVRDYLKSDEYVEYTARRVLGLVLPGETLVVVSSSAPVTPTVPPPDSGQWWKDLFIPTPTPTPAPQASP